MENLPLNVSLFFGITTLATLLLFCWAIKNSGSGVIKAFLVMLSWLMIQAALSLNGVYNGNLD